MPDVHDKQTRSRNMAAIKGKNTKPELILRSLLHQAGFRFRLNSTLPGKPDLILPKYRAAVFMHGCFWHSHGCPRFKQPTENSDFWRRKLERNIRRDKEVSYLLKEAGWRQLIIWECTIIGKGRMEPEKLINLIKEWLISESQYGEISGQFK